MELYSENQTYKLFQGNMLDLGEVIEPCSIDSIVTDPPYELNFMGKGWDNSGIAFQPDTWKRCLDVLKPGGYLLAFGGSRTYHRIACAIEDAGFEIRDCIMWLYGSGFPKSLNLAKAIEGKLTVGSANTTEFHKLKGDEVDVKSGYTKMEYDQGNKPANYQDRHNSIVNVEYTTELAKQREGRGTQLKPSYEPIIVARKPLEGSCTDNVIKYGVGGINIDECRVPFEDTPNPATNPKYRKNAGYKLPEKGQTSNGAVSFTSSKNETNDLGRFPANTILTYDESDFEEVCGGFPDTKSGSKMSFGSVRKAQPDNTYQLGFTKHENSGQTAPDNYGDSGNASRYFYCAKASKRDRDEGLDEFEEKRKAGYGYDLGLGNAGEGMFKDRTTVKKNVHPTVKPTDLMQYLVRLVTPNGGTVLDPFNGSGSTGKAVMYENKDRNKNYKYIGIELTEEYLPIAKARIEYVINKGIEKEKEEEKAEGFQEQPLFS